MRGQTESYELKTKYKTDRPMNVIANAASTQTRLECLAYSLAHYLIAAILLKIPYQNGRQSNVLGPKA